MIIDFKEGKGLLEHQKEKANVSSTCRAVTRRKSQGLALRSILFTLCINQEEVISGLYSPLTESGRAVKTKRKGNQIQNRVR